MATISASRTAPMAADVSRMDQGTTHPYTCNTCQVAFRNIDLQKGHMRSDWHRYNLKRRVASLPPISSEVFTEKVLQSRAEVTAQTDKASFETTCEACSKTYFSENSYKNHISSKNHKMRAASLAARGPATNGRTKADDEVSSVMSSTFSLGEPASEAAKSEVDSDAEEEFNEVVEGIKQAKIEDAASPVDRPENPHLSAADQHKDDHPVEDATTSEQPETSGTATPTQPEADNALLKQCLFCNYESPTPALNATHMERIHGMFIPEKQYLVDLEGLLGSLRRRVFELNECLMCGKMRSNAFAVQTHMRDKGHCQIPYTTEEEQLEIGEFYDFRSTYSDGGDWDTEDAEEEEEEGAGGAKLGSKREAKVEVLEGEEDGEGGDEEGWETDSSASSLDSDDLHAVPGEGHYHQYERLASHRHHSRDDPRPHRQADGYHAHSKKGVHAVYYDEYELHLPSGRSVGHRSLNRYFRQNLHNYPTPEERQQQLLLEAARENGDENAEMQYDSDGEPRFRRNTEIQLRDRKAHGRHVITRETRGLIGANAIRDVVESKEIRKVVEKGRQREVDSYKRAEVVGMKKHFKERHRNPVSYLR